MYCKPKANLSFLLHSSTSNRIRSMVTLVSVVQDGLVVIVILTLMTALLTLVSMDSAT